MIRYAGERDERPAYLDTKASSIDVVAQEEVLGLICVSTDL